MINWLAVLVAAIVSFILGWAWYSDKLFGRTWRQLVGVTEEMHQTMAANKQRMVWTMSVYFVSLVLMAYVIENVLNYVGAFGVSDGLSWGFCLWLGFSVSASIGSVIFERRPWKFWFINAGYMLVAMLVSGVILVLWN